MCYSLSASVSLCSNPFFFFNKYCYDAQIFCEVSCGTHPVSEVQKCGKMQKNEGEMQENAVVQKMPTLVS